MSPRVGRPLSNNPKTKQLAVRLDIETLKQLDVLAHHNEETRVETIRRAIRVLYKEYLKENK